MAVLLELKEKIKRVFNKYDVYIVPAFKFVIALVSFLMINMSIGYMAKIRNPLFAVLASVICAFTPNGVTIFILSMFILAHLYAISLEFAAIALGVMLLMYLLYFRFTPKSGYILIVTIMLCWIKMPYMIPVAVGLCSSALAVIPVTFGVIIFYIIKTASAYETAITNQSVSDSVQQISYIIESILSDKQMLVIILGLVLTIVAVYFVRKLTIDNSWTYAIITGTAVQFVVLIIGEIILKANLNLVLVIIGIILGAVIGYLCQILFFSVDYKRTEFVQYEDDEYFYYVKAVPKINIMNADVKVKQINARKIKNADGLSDMKNSSKHISDDEDEE